MRIAAGKHVIVAGYVPRDAEVRTTQTGKSVCNFSVKSSETVNADGTRAANWLNCVAWQKACDVARYIQKGDIVLAAGELQERSYTSRDGEEKSVTELVCEFVMIMQNAVVTAPMFPEIQEASSNGSTPSDFEEIVTDDDLPF